MTRKMRRLVIVLACGAVAAKAPSPGRTIRLGGLVQAGSLHLVKVDGEPTARFVVTDGKSTLPVSYTGILPDLFREGQGVVALGTIQPDHSFRAQEVLAKHDETYMPKDVADALKRSGHWNPAKGSPTMASAQGLASASRAN
jgi:cytochrome c-type biogenesis protein CcmE